MRFVIFNRDYPGFLRGLYLANPGLQDASYSEQLALRNESLFGVADFYSRNFKAHGHDAIEIHLNNPWMQYAWAREHGLKVTQPASPFRRSAVSVWPVRLLMPAARRLRQIAKLASALPRFLPHALPPAAGGAEWENLILSAQIADFHPDVILNQEMAAMRSPVLKKLKRSEALFIGQIASSLPEDESFDAYDLVISSLPNQVCWFSARGVTAQLNRLAFEP